MLTRGIPPVAEHEIRAISVPGDTIIQVWKDKRLLQIISMIHVATIIYTGRKKKNRKTNPDIGFQYSKCMKGIDTADHYSVVRKTFKQLNVCVELLLFSMHFLCSKH